eukprot:m.33411 g.33411  ORF g.33411 m.33411 type:complete len:286 (-) comp12233_c0_seq1:147-1004(-)
MAGSKHIKRNPIAWSMWANVLAVYAANMMIVGGLLSQFGFKRSGIGIAVIVLGVFVLFFEWPRPKRSKGNTIPREYQYSIGKVVNAFGPFARNYFFRCVVWLMASIPCFFVFPAIVGGVTLAVAALVYLLAAFKGEQWKLLEPRAARGPGKELKAPSKPPPRLPTQAPSNDDSTGPHRRMSAPNKPVPRPGQPLQSSTTTQNTDMEQPPQRSVPVPKPKPRPKAKAAASNPKDAFSDWAWESAQDPNSGQVYYINTKSDETTWEKPPRWDEYLALYGEPDTTYEA